MADLSRSNIVVISRMAADDYRESTPGRMRFSAEFSGYAIKQKTAGKRLAWHHHEHDIAPLPDGSFPIEHLFKASPDIFWDILPAVVRQPRRTPGLRPLRSARAGNGSYLVRSVQPVVSRPRDLTATVATAGSIVLSASARVSTVK
jgi:hypothetical protein